MDAASYIASFASILFGLAIGDLLLDLDRLLSRRREVIWSVLPLLAAVMITIALIAGWWDLYRTLSFRPVMTIADFLPHFAKLVLLFLIAAATLPSHSADRLDLRRYYYENSRYLYSLWCLLLLLIAAIGLGHGAPLWSFGIGLVAVRLALFVVLAWTKRPVAHYVLLPILTASLLAMWVMASL